MLIIMKNKIPVYSILTVFYLFGNLEAGPVITMFMEPYPLMPQSEDAQVLVNKLKKPGKIAKIKVKALQKSPLVKGIFSTYAGYLAMSDNDGQTIFPKKHVAPMVYVLITNRITPALMAGNTIHHWDIQEGAKAKMYKIERLHEEGTNIYYWHTEKVPLPAHNHIPLDSITILAKPDHIFVPEGIQLTNDAVNLLLPTIFVKKGIQTNLNALYVLNVRQFFGDIHPTYKKGTLNYLMQVGN